MEGTMKRLLVGAMSVATLMALAVSGLASWPWGGGPIG
jgi:hypothetical protein